MRDGADALDQTQPHVHNHSPVTQQGETLQCCLPELPVPSKCWWGRAGGGTEGSGSSSVEVKQRLKGSSRSLEMLCHSPARLQGFASWSVAALLPQLPFPKPLPCVALV